MEYSMRVRTLMTSPTQEPKLQRFFLELSHRRNQTSCIQEPAHCSRGRCSKSSAWTI